ncbi:MAG: hypothetical protein P4L41_00160, partial [Flavipsychrobacter sp.]|nr:hypothetical protein [Flavipsychrobacter sp.]
MSGVAQTRSVHQQNGVIILDGGTGTVTVSGKLIASGSHRHSTGGTIKVLANNVHLTGTASIDASGSLGGGEILIGGNEHGAGPEANAVTTTVDAGATLMANAGTLGNGGKIVVWSNNNTAFHGSISATGGSAGGNGGFVETSGGYLDVANARVNLLAPKGLIGNWLLDPENITIISNSGSNTNGSYNGGSPTNTFTATGDNSIVDVNLLIANLNSANVTILTGSTGSQSGNITVSSPISWSGATTLSLNAAGAIAINAAITALNGTLALSASNTTASITASAAVNVSNFLLNQGQWSQTSSLPVFNVTNNFQIASGAQFLRVAGGTGSSGSPYQLTDVYGLQGAATLALNNNYILNNNIDATVTAHWNSGAGFNAIAGGNTSTNAVSTFTGSFDGQYHTINGLFINRPTYNFQGLFGNVTSGAATVIQNLGLSNVNITANNSTGGIAGAINGTGSNVLINNSYVTGNIVLNSGGGGLVGSFATGYPSNTGGIIENSYNAANVTLIGAGSIGGIASGTINGSLLYSYNIGTLTALLSGSSVSIGGLIGGICYGCNGAVGNATLNYSYNSGLISYLSGNSVGALIAGSNDLNSYANFYDTTINPTITASGPGSNYGISSAGLTTGEMMDITNFNSNTTANGNIFGSNATWSIASATSSTPNASVWFMVNGATRPMLTTEEFLNNTPLAINSGHQLQLINADLGANYILGGNIDLSKTANTVANNSDIWGGSYGAGFAPIANSTYFPGNFNGAGYVINNLNINSPSVRAVGLFGSLSGMVQNVGVTNANIIAYDQVGVIVGIIGNNGTVKNAYSTGSVTGDGDSYGIGGLVGMLNSNSALVEYSFNAATVKGTDRVGGVVGQSFSGTILDSYNIGSISSTSTGASNGVGGLIGNIWNGGATITNSYSLGMVSGTSTNIGGFVGLVGNGVPFNSTNNFWDTATSGVLTSSNSYSNVTGVSTANLQGPSGTASSTYSGDSNWTLLANAFPILNGLYGTAPVIISGTVPSLTSGTTVYLATGSGSVSAVNSNGLTVGSENSFANGYYYFIEPGSVAASGSTILTYTTANNAASGTAVTNSVDLLPSSGVISGLNLTTGQVTVGDAIGSQTNFSNTTLANAFLSGESLYLASGNNITFNNNINFLTRANATDLFTINGSMTAQGTGILTFGSPTTINNGGATIASATNQNYNGTVTLGSNAVITDSGNNSTVSF